MQYSRHLKNQNVIQEPQGNRLNFAVKKKRPLDSENEPFNGSKKVLQPKKDNTNASKRRILGDLSNQSSKATAPGLKKQTLQKGDLRTFLQPKRRLQKEEERPKPSFSMNEQTLRSEKEWDINEIEPIDIEELDLHDEMSICDESSVLIDSVIAEIPAIQDLSIASLDQEDLPDPQIPTEYIHDIYNWCLRVESDTLTGTYLEGRRMTPGMRTILVDWLIDVFINFSLRPETIFLCVQILDRFIAKKPISRTKLQLAGACSLLIASKYEDVYAPEINDLIFVAKNSFSESNMKDMEECICKTLGFRFSLPSSFTFLQRYLKATFSRADLNEEFDREEEHGVIIIESLYFCLLSLLSYECLQFKPSMIAASAMYLTFCRLEMNWNEDLVRYTGYNAKDVSECAGLMFSIYRSDRDAQRSPQPGSNVSIPTQHYSANKLEELASKVLS